MPVEDPVISGGAEERRLRRMKQCAASLPRRRPGEERVKATPLELCEIPVRRGDDALLVNQGIPRGLQFSCHLCIELYMEPPDGKFKS